MNKKGFTILEMILTLAVVSIFFGFAIFGYQASQVRSDMNSQAELLTNHIRLLRSNAESGRVDAPNSIYLSDEFYVTFVGDEYDSDTLELLTYHLGWGCTYQAKKEIDDSGNDVFYLPPTMEITNINLNGGGNSIVFEAPHGNTENFGSFDLHSESLGETITFNITKFGTIDY